MANIYYIIAEVYIRELKTYLKTVESYTLGSTLENP